MKPPSRLLIALALLAFAAAGWAAQARQNLALGKPVTISSVLLGDPAGAVNGFVEWGQYAVHTRNGSAWFIIDLEATAAIDEIRIFGRGDGFFSETTASMGVDVSLDGKAFHAVGKNCQTFVSQVAPCLVRAAGESARFVRVRHPSHLVLSEVEVFGP